MLTEKCINLRQNNVNLRHTLPNNLQQNRKLCSPNIVLQSSSLSFILFVITQIIGVIHHTPFQHWRRAAPLPACGGSMLVDSGLLSITPVPDIGLQLPSGKSTASALSTWRMNLIVDLSPRKCHSQQLVTRFSKVRERSSPPCN